MDCKAVLVLAMAVAILACDVSAWGRTEMGTEMGSVTLINGGIFEGITIKQCSGPDGSRTVGEGFIYVPPRSPDHEYFEFHVDSLSQGWRCDFEYVSAATNVLHTANVLVWEGMLRAASTQDDEEASSSSNSLIGIATVPCINCIWKIQADGFYRADDNNHEVFRRLAGWTPA